MRTVFVFLKNAITTHPYLLLVRVPITLAVVRATEWLRQYQRSTTNGQA